jgi:hypothetical protein
MKNSIRPLWMLVAALSLTSIACVSNTEAEAVDARQDIGSSTQGFSDSETLRKTIAIPGQGMRSLKSPAGEENADQPIPNGPNASQANRSSGITPPDHNVKAGGPDPVPWQPPPKDNK